MAFPHIFCLSLFLLFVFPPVCFSFWSTATTRCFFFLPLSRLTFHGSTTKTKHNFERSKKQCSEENFGFAKGFGVCGFFIYSLCVFVFFNLFVFWSKNKQQLEAFWFLAVFRDRHKTKLEKTKAQQTFEDKCWFLPTVLFLFFLSSLFLLPHVFSFLEYIRPKTRKTQLEVSFAFRI